MSNVTIFYIVRHGETEWNALSKIQGQSDIPLNASGKTQAKKRANELKHVKFDMAFSSDLLRAKETAEIIALEHNLAVKTTQLLRERNYGEFEGAHFDSMKTHQKLMDTLDHNERYKHKITQNVESDEEIATRLLTFLRETAVAYPGKTILVASHGAIMRMIMLHLGEISYEKMKWFKNLGYVVLETDGVDFYVKKTEGFE